MSVKSFTKDLSCGIDARSLNNNIEEKSSIFADSKYTQFQKRYSTKSCVHSSQLNLFQHIKFLPAIFLLYFGSVNALEEGIGASNLISESIFDFLIIVIIPVILTTEVNRKLDESKAFIKLLLYVHIIISLGIGGLRILFLVKIYKATDDFFFMIYLIIELGIPLVFLIVFILVRDAFYPVILNGVSIFTKNLVFLFLAVEKGYVDSDTYLFVLLPVILAFIIGMITFMYKRKEDENTHISDKRMSPHKLFRADYGKYRRPMWTIEFCCDLIFCLIAAPSVIWIKMFLALLFTCYTVNDFYLRLKERVEQRQKVDAEKAKTSELEETRKVDD
ncbi:2767_t:CDS:1 [Acaulospora morrowiae]|uniref:2767_t:CDS:1 n=1 Tax=Acaulospora morrowiae TaxID=94023 RepID=A0A9N9GE05_9GLOM|nr:2767_t:CDS:1 [Acaulospora morrowiae]